jgi:protein TilB
MGGDITQEMIRRRSEHNECVLYTMEELVLQEESIERIDKTLGILCPRLKILYMPNNLIPRFENLHKLKELEYLNMAMNNITKIEGLEKCEQLQKLDLTLNFVDLKNLHSVASLNANVHLTELFLTGNPCSDWDGCRSYIITKLPHLKVESICIED